MADSLTPESFPTPQIEQEPNALPSDLDDIQGVGVRPDIAEAPGESWLRRHRKMVAGGAVFAAAVAISATQFSKVEHAVEQDAEWAAPAIGATETAAWGGAALILLSAGKRIGNPMTVKSRLNEIKQDLEHNKLYKTGLAINILGAAGTSAVITTAAVTSAPESTWPLAFVTAGASLGFSGLPWVLASRGRSTTPSSAENGVLGHEE